MIKNSSFLADYINLLSAAVDADYQDNHDKFRFGAENLTSRDLKRQLVQIKKNSQQVLVDSGLLTIHAGIQFIQNSLTELEWIYRNLSDEDSKKTIVAVIAYRALGHRKIKLPLNTPAYWQMIREAEHAVEGSESFDLGFLGFRAYKTDLSHIGYPIQLFFTPRGLVTQFQLQQYRCETINGLIQVEPGDIVIDGGGCYGDTALYFAHKAGPNGKVFSFEFLPENLEKWQKNVKMNPVLESRIQLVPHALWTQSGEELFITGHGPGTQVSSQTNDPHAQKVTTRSIDDLVNDEKLNAVDFIKMDIEGAEQNALKGAEQTIRRFKPKLAITVYHSLNDFWEIPMWVDQLGLGYKFYLRHFTIHAEETVLFAVTDVF
jgi:FkbM family methyltransferase